MTSQPVGGDQPSDTGDTTFGLRAAAEELGVHYMTAYRYVRTGLLPATLDGDEWRVHAADLAQFRATPRLRPGRRTAATEAGSPVQPTPQRTKLARQLQSRLIVGDEAGAWQILQTAMTAGAEPASLYSQVIEPALAEIGMGWRNGQISIAEEHLASAITGRLIGRLGPRFITRGHRRATVVLGAAPGERHSFAPSILADLARSVGFHALDLGADVPAEAFVHAAANTTKLLCIGISASTKRAAANIRPVVDALRAAHYDGPVLVGGHAITSKAAARRRGGDEWASNSDAFVDLLQSLHAAK